MSEHRPPPLPLRDFMAPDYREGQDCPDCGEQYGIGWWHRRFCKGKRVAVNPFVDIPYSPVREPIDSHVLSDDELAAIAALPRCQVCGGKHLNEVCAYVAEREVEYNDRGVVKHERIVYLPRPALIEEIDYEH